MKTIKCYDDRYYKSEKYVNVANIVEIMATDKEITYTSVYGHLANGYSPTLYSGTKENVKFAKELIEEFLQNDKTFLDLKF